MIKLIKNELIKIFKRKTIYFLLILSMIAVIIYNYINPDQNIPISEGTNDHPLISDTQIEKQKDDSERYINSMAYNEFARLYNNNFTKDSWQRLALNKERNGYSYEKDDEERIILAEGDLHLGQGVRDTSAQLKAGGEFRRDTDEGGHLIGSRFGGSGELNNLIAQNRFINRSAYKTFENAWADELESGNDVHVKIEPYYQEKTKRPHAIMGRYTITDQRGQKQEEVFSLTNENLNEEEFELSEEADDI